jgi:hypothetical protein
MDFHLSFPIPPFQQKINYSHKFLFVGSCFAENIGELMQRYKFESIINPNGILYNPVSISNSLNNIIENKQINESELFFANECWNNWDFHSKFSNPNQQECLKAINTSISTTHDFLKQSNWLFITLGSSYIYEHNNTGTTVANCHKIPQKEFTKRLLSVDEIVTSFETLIEKVNEFNPDLKIVFTISPVRYIRDGVVENNRSKARLIEAVHELTQKRDYTFYFPAYELVIDDLRDYRFYKNDMVHPNEQAIEYVFEKLKDVFFDEESKHLFEKIQNIVTASSHRPFHENSLSHKKFKENYIQQCKQLMIDYPFLNLNKEFDVFNS